MIIDAIVITVGNAHGSPVAIDQLGSPRITVAAFGSVCVCIPVVSLAS